MERMETHSRLIKYFFVAVMGTWMMLISASLWFALTDSGAAFDITVTLASVLLVVFTGFMVMVLSRRTRGY